MRKWTVRAARTVLVGAAFVAASAGIANADNTSGDHSVLGGAQPHVPVTVPLVISGNALNLLSSGNAVSSGEAPHVHLNHNDNSGAVASGAIAGTTTPARSRITICGNATSSEGIGTAACRGHATVAEQQPAETPTVICGNATASEGVSTAACRGHATVSDNSAEAAAPACDACAQAAAPACDATCAPQRTSSTTIGRITLIRHDEGYGPAATPITICGNSGAVRGIAAAACEGNASFLKGAPSMVGAG